MILQWYDPVFWPQANEFEAGYIHKLCVREKYTGRKISRLMVDFAVDECRERGIHYLRLDTGWGNKRLCELYESLGFVKVDKYMLGDRAFALFEMRID
jgi:ribosomal protein S18 acetylase RimI-like enzyme